MCNILNYMKSLSKAICGVIHNIRKSFNQYKSNIKQIKSTEYNTRKKNENITSIDKELARIFNYFFVNKVPNLGMNTNHNFLINMDNESNPKNRAIVTYKNIPVLS